MPSSTPPNATTAELAEILGANIKAMRIRGEIRQETLAERAGVSLSALRNLEVGRGVALKTMIAVLRALGRADYLNMLAPEPTISPMQILRATKTPRQRAYTPRKRTPRE
jgi:transcriptional regulator with XRE-family HTH domain